MIELLKPNGPIKTAVQLSGSKSISNRLLILNAVLQARLHFSNLSTSEDTQLLQKALEQIKAGKDRKIDVHHAGTDMRFLTAFLSVTPGTWTITGSARMKQRPIGELVTALAQLGADIRYLEQEGFPPLEINGRELKGGVLQIDSSQSSQFISALLLIAPAFRDGLTLQLKGRPVSFPYIQMTLELLGLFGLHYQQAGNSIHILPAAPRMPVGPLIVESDWSSASYWYSICALAPKAGIELSHLTEQSLQADSVLPQLYARLGVSSSFAGDTLRLTRTGNPVPDFHYDFTGCPDISLTVAATCFGLGISARLEGLSTLKIKESDRIQALKTELEKLGARVEAGSDWLHISPAQQGKPAGHGPVQTYNDHRMAMSFAPLALSTGRVLIQDPDVVVKSYPAFWQDLKSAGFNVNLQP